MRHRSLSSRFVFVCVGCLALASGAAQRRWTVSDGIELSVFLHPGSQYMQSSEISFSPDGAHIIAATMRGDLASGKRVATVWLFGREGVENYLRGAGEKAFQGAKPLLRAGSASNRDPISRWSWSSDSRSVLYLATDDDGVRSLYRAGVQDGAAATLSRAGQDVSKFDERNGAIVYLAHAPIRANDLYQAGGPSLPDMEDATGKNVLPLMFPNWMDAQFQSSEDELWRVADGHATVVLSIDGKTPVRVKDSKLSVSPDGRVALVTTFVKRIPKSWERYKSLLDYPGMQIVADTPETVGSTGHYRPQQYAIVDLASGAISLLADSPIDFTGRYNDAVTAAWSADGSRVALPGAYPPLADASASGGIYPCTIAVVQIKTKEFSCLQPEQPVGLSKHPYGSRKQMVTLQWRGNGLVAQFRAPNAREQKTITLYTRRSNGTWTAKNGSTAVPERKVTIKVKQALDQPPVLVASAANGVSKPLLDPNPRLAEIARGTVALYNWHDADGNLWTGALVKPPDFTPGRRYPLVIQTHTLDRTRFLIDGPSATGFAARALAARDMLVLQVDEIGKNAGTPKESETGAAGYRAAIQQLTSEGLVDPAKVGIITWSHMGPYVVQGLIDQPDAYAAATISEADFNSYPEYLMNIDYMGKEREQMFRAQIGPQPFAEGLHSWLELSPGFHLDRICTPILFELNSPAALLYSWPDYAALRAQNKPVDLFYIRNGDHVLVKPRERLAEQGRNVDWYDYWLNGHADPDPTKAAQYELWDRMKTLLHDTRCARVNVG